VRSLLSLFSAISHAFGSQRRLVRRIAALCLVFMGVHLAADHLDDVVYTILDAIDLVVDNTVAAFLDWLSQAGGMEPASALSASEKFATFIDLAEKDKLALAIALVVELLLDVMLFDLAWGRHVDEDVRGLLGEIGASARQMRDALSPLDLERLAVIPTLACYAFGGAVTAALAVENVTRGLIQRVAPDFLWAGHVAAGLGILAAALLLWRFLPDLLHGALLRSRGRFDKARERTDEKLKKPHRYPRLARVNAMFGLHTRGAWLFAVALPLAVAGLASHDIGALIDRVQVIPE
jgi:hypothetical protein